MLSEKGFSLIEVLVSLTILSVSVISIAHFFNQSNDVSSFNNNKLVATNLARMTLERVQHSYGSFGIVKNTAKHYDITVCTTDPDCKKLYAPTINSNVYEIEIDVKNQTSEEASIKLFPVTVKVNYPTKQNKKSTSVEGYMKYAE
jgi:prepilin-type N-terminal cleavage/methylation domain-containing protein